MGVRFSSSTFYQTIKSAYTDSCKYLFCLCNRIFEKHTLKIIFKMLKNFSKIGHRGFATSGTSLSRKHNWQSETLMDIGTGKNYNEDHDMFREQCRKFWKNIDPKRVQQWDRNWSVSHMKN